MSSSTFSDLSHVVADLLDAEQPGPQPGQRSLVEAADGDLLDPEDPERTVDLI